MMSTHSKKRKNRKKTFRSHAMIGRMFLGIMLLAMVLPAYAGNNLCISSAVGFIEDGGMAIEGHLNEPTGVAVDKQGNIYIADSKHHRVRKVENGTISTIAGTGVPGYDSEDLPAKSSKLNSPMDVAIDSQGNIYIADFGNHCIRKVNTDGMISTYAGTGNAGFSGDGDFASSAQLNFPTGISIDSDDNLFIADMMNNRIRIVYSMTKKIDTFAGNGDSDFGGDGENARSAMLNHPRGVFADNKNGFVWIADTDNHRVRYVDTFVNVINTVAGNGTAGDSGDGNDAIGAQLNSPSRIVLDNDGYLYISDTKNNRVRKVVPAEPDGTITTYVGGGSYKIDGVHPSMASIDSPFGIVFDSSNRLYIAIAGDNLCRKISQDSPTMITVAGLRNKFFTTPPLSTALHEPKDIYFDNDNNAFIADTESHLVLKYDRSSGRISPVAGNGEVGKDGNGSEPTLARLRSPASVLVSKDGNYLYISEPENHWIRVVDFTQDPPTINIFAGDGNMGVPEVGQFPTDTSINYPVGLYHDKRGNIYFADRDNHCVYKIDMYDSERTIERIAGNGIADISPDGTNATSASLNKPVDIWVDRFDRIFIADSGNKRVCMVNDEKIQTIMTNLLLPEGVAGNDKYLVVTDTHSHLAYRLELNKLNIVCPCDANNYIIAGLSGTDGGFSGDGGPSLLSRIGSPQGIAIDNNGDIFFADKENNRIRILSENVCDSEINKIKTIAGLFDLRGLALETSIREAAGVTTDDTGKTFYSDSKNHRVVRIDANGYIKTIAGNGTSGYSGDGDDATKAQLNSPQGLEFINGVLYIADKGNHCIRKVDQDGNISTIAGNGFPGIRETPVYDLSQNCLNEPVDIVMNTKGELFISDSKNHRIVKLINETDSMLLVAGTGAPGFSGDAAPAINASLNTPLGIALDMDENLMIADAGNNRVRIIYNDSAKNIDTYAGTGISDPLVDDTWADESNLSYPTDVAVDTFENVYISDSGHNRIRIVNSLYRINTFAANGSADCSNENAIASLASLNTPGLLAINTSDALLVADQCHRIVQIELSNSFERIAGNTYNGFSGDDGPAKSAALNLPYDVASDQWSNVFVADKNNHCIRKISLDGTMTTIAGNTNPGFSGDGLPAIYASLNSPHGVAVNMNGDIFITDTENNRIRVIWKSTSIIDTFAGNGEKGNPLDNDDGLASFASLNAPKGIAVSSSGNIFFVDSGNRKVRKIDFESRKLITIANYTKLGSPYGLAVDLQRNVYVSDILKHQVLKISPSFTVTTYAGDGTTDYFYTEEDKAATSASLYTTTFLDVDQASNLYILDTGHHRIRKVIESSRTIVTVAGDGEPGFSEEGQNPIFASLNMPNGISVGLDGNIVVADSSNHYVRKIFFKPFPVKWTVDTSQYQFHQIIRADALLNDNHIIRPGDKVAVFVGDEIRGFGYPARTSEGNQLFIVAWGNEADVGENMTLKYYRKNDNNIYDIEQSIQFQPELNDDTLVRIDLKRTLECQDRLNQFTSYKLMLPEGWHLLSSYNSDMVIIKSESTCIGAIFEYNGGEYQPVTPETIAQTQQATLSPIDGFWLNTTGECTVTVEAIY